MRVGVVLGVLNRSASNGVLECSQTFMRLITPFMGSSGQATDVAQAWYDAFERGDMSAR